MLECFTARARRSIVLATEEARSRRHESISPEHLLVGILRDGDGMAVKVLERLQAPSEMLRADVEHLLDGVPRSSMRPEPVFSPELRAVLQAAVEARQQQSRLIGTEDLLLGLLSREGSEPNRVLRAAGVTFDAARGVISAFYNSVAVPIRAETIRAIARSKWGVQFDP